MIKSLLRKASGRIYLTETQLTTFTTELEGIIDSQSPMHFLSLKLGLQH